MLFQLSELGMYYCPMPQELHCITQMSNGGQTHPIGYGYHSSIAHRQALQYPKTFPSSGARYYSGAKCVSTVQQPFPQTAWPGF